MTPLVTLQAPALAMLTSMLVMLPAGSTPTAVTTVTVPLTVPLGLVVVRVAMSVSMQEMTSKVFTEDNTGVPHTVSVPRARTVT
ncbi:MAG: hypothetical protein P1P84_23020, partial [Deferrisomatales bacterium]|nr:hypothetical protein [Deferrisomatales bacterium]